jgi:hypothetical protein
MTHSTYPLGAKVLQTSPLGHLGTGPFLVQPMTKKMPGRCAKCQLSLP